MYMRKELNGMFTEGQLVIYGGEGVCRIAAVGPSSLSGTDKTKLYYTLTPLDPQRHGATPVDTKVLMRPHPQPAGGGGLHRPAAPAAGRRSRRAAVCVC